MAHSNGAATRGRETDSLLPKGKDSPKGWGNGVLYRCLLCAFLVSLSFGVTQVPLVYVFHVMTCDAYYERHPLPPPGFHGDKCSNHEIDASTARQYALVGASTTLFGLFNLFITGWLIKRIGVKSTLAIQVFWPAVRLLVQNIGVFVGKDLGMIIIQLSQIITIVGGPLGYVLALNSLIAEVVEDKDRTGALGKLQGCMFIGTAIGFLAGGLIAEDFGIQMPFLVTLVMFTLASVYVLVFLPWLPPVQKDDKKATQGLSRFFGPLKIFAPQKWTSPDGQVRLEYGTLFLGIGCYLAILATGYIPVMLQMFATDWFGFGTARNSYMVSLNSFLRGLYLTLIFPEIIKYGRKWTSSREQPQTASEASTLIDSTIPDIPTSPAQIESGGPMEAEEEPIAEPQAVTSDKENYDFDLLYAKASLLADGIMTGAATFINQSWQLYLIAALLPFAAGTGSAAKGTILQMCRKEERVDALSAITLVENMARLSTVGIFGLIFAAFAEIGKQNLVFACNAAVALLGVLVLLFCRFPLPESERYIEIDDEPEQ